MKIEPYGGCPVQADGIDDNGRHFYARSRGTQITVDFGVDEKSAVSGSEGGVGIYVPDRFQYCMGHIDNDVFVEVVEQMTTAFQTVMDWLVKNYGEDGRKP